MLKQFVFVFIVALVVGCVSNRKYKALSLKLKEVASVNEQLRSLNDSLMTITVVQKPIVQIDRLEQVVYRHIDNPLTIKVPNAIEVHIEGEKIKHIEGDRYVYTPWRSQSSIVVHAKFKNGKETRDTVKFVVKDFERWVAMVNKEQGRVRMTKRELKDAVFSVKIPGFWHKHEVVVHDFRIHMPYGEGISVKGNKLDERAKQFIDELALNKEVYFFRFNCTLKGVGMGRFRICKSPTPIIVELVDE